MRKVIITSIISTIIVVVASAFGVRHYTQASTPVGLYEADVDHDGYVSILDLAAVAQYFTQAAPLPTPPVPTPTPGPAWRQYTRTASWPNEYSFQVWCDWGDRLLAGSWSWSPITQTNPVTGATRNGASISTPGAYSVSVTCFDEYEYNDPLASFCFETYTATAWVTRCT